MRTGDLIRLAVGGLWRQKARTLLTLAGVAVGACSLAFSLSLGVGLRALIDREFQSRPGFWDIHVYAGGGLPQTPVPADAVAVEGNLSADRAARLRKEREFEYRQMQHQQVAKPLTPEVLAGFAARPDVVEVRSHRQMWGRWYYGERMTHSGLVVAKTGLPKLADRVVAGRLPGADEAGVAVSEMLLYELGVRDEAGFAAAVGQPVRFEMGEMSDGRQRSFAQLLGHTAETTPRQLSAAAKLLGQMPTLLDRAKLTDAERAELKLLFAGESKPKPKTPFDPERPTTAVTLPVVGVVRAADSDEKDDSRGSWVYRTGRAFVPPAAVDSFIRQQPGSADARVNDATVSVKPGADLPAVVADIEGQGYGTSSAVQWYAGAKREVTLIAAGLNVFALVSLLVAASGITNTLVSSVLERTREIGILKAVGARDGAILLMFLLEGTLIGAAGGLLGLGAARLIAGPADGLVKQMVQESARGEKLLSESIFEFPPWLCLTTAGFAVLVTTLAAAYPARRAARVPPVEALRHE